MFWYEEVCTMTFLSRLGLYALLATFVLACSSEPHTLEGKWKVNSPFYRAKYKIVRTDDGELKAHVLYYNDDTYEYSASEGKEKYLFENLVEKDGKYVDAVSGATSTKNEAHNIELKIITNDSLRVTTYIMGKPVVESWTRVK